MRSRAVLLVVAILLIAGFAALNWGEIIRPVPVWFGPFMMDAPLGAILLGLLALATVIFAVAAGAMRTHSLVESRHHYKTLEAQRELADKAEASRFTELRQHLDTRLSELRDRDHVAVTEFEKTVVQSQREMRTQLEQINRTIAARLTELEHRIDSRMGHAPAALHHAPVVTPVHSGPAGQPGLLHPEHGQSQHQLRDAQLREAQLREQRLREERARVEHHVQDPHAQHERVRDDIRREERAAAADRPAEQSGWRKWF